MKLKLANFEHFWLALESLSHYSCKPCINANLCKSCINIAKIIYEISGHYISSVETVCRVSGY